MCSWFSNEAKNDSGSLFPVAGEAKKTANAPCISLFELAYQKEKTSECARCLSFFQITGTGLEWEPSP